MNTMMVPTVRTCPAVSCTGTWMSFFGDVSPYTALLADNLSHLILIETSCDKNMAICKTMLC